MAGMINRQIGELERTRANMLQLGTVQEADYAQARVRVQLNGLDSAWLPWTVQRAGGDRQWTAPEVGEQVIVACPDGDPANGVVLGSVYQVDAAAPADSADVSRTVYADGAVVEYDRAAHALTATLPSGGTADIDAPGGVHVTALGGVQIDGPVTIDGPLTVTELVTAQDGITAGGTVGASGCSVQVSGTMCVEVDVIAGPDDISLVTHDHETIVGEPI